MKFTKERVVPEVYHINPLLYYWHISRYRFARQFVGRNSDVLDVACGTGYGAYELATTAKSVTGVDIDAETIAFAKQHFGTPRTTFIRANGSEIAAVLKGPFDTCVSFETIEHLTAEEQKGFLAGVRSLLSPDGSLVISTPNTELYDPDQAGSNPFHKHELTVQAFVALLGEFFEEVYLYGQRLTHTFDEKMRLARLSRLLRLMKRPSRAAARDLAAVSPTMIAQESDIEFTIFDVSHCLYVVAVCRRPRPATGR